MAAQVGLNASVSEARAEVLVVGAGPSGLFSAVELARHGISSRLVEREARPHRQARATALQPATLEILCQAGVLDETLAASEHLGFARVFDLNLRPVAEMAFAGSGCQWEYQCSLPQWHTEQILTERLLALGGRVERGLAAVSLEPRNDGVLVTLQGADGSVEKTEASWVIGAGGAHSVTRASMAEELVGETYPGTALAADVLVSCDLPRDGSALIAGAEGYVMLAPLPDKRWLAFVGDLEQREVDLLAHDRSVAAVAECFERRVGPALQVLDAGWAAPFRMHRRLVGRLAGDRRFLLGDAGHLSSPFGGEGLNSGLHDAHNLAWKLALELRRQSRPDLLASFESERLAADTHVLEVSERLHQLAHDAVESARTGVRPRPPTPDQVAALVRSRSMLDVSYADSALVGEYVAAGQEAAPLPGPGDRYPGRTGLGGTEHHVLLLGGADDAGVTRLRERWRGLVDVSAGDTEPDRARLDSPAALLVRPDGHVGFRAVPADAAGIEALDAHLASYLVPA
jgi:6-methylpretetramide 4-monooxygenase / 4-hydroxy-6-methylpretetramide 12a-monooxygenase